MIRMENATAVVMLLVTSVMNVRLDIMDFPNVLVSLSKLQISRYVIVLSYDGCFFVSRKTQA